MPLQHYILLLPPTTPLLLVLFQSPLTPPFAILCCPPFFLSAFNSAHNSAIPIRIAGNILYCKLYKFFLCIGGTNRPVTRHSITPGET